MKPMEQRSVAVLIVGIFITLIGISTDLNNETKYTLSYEYFNFLSLFGIWLISAGWSSYALVGKGYKPGFSIALAFLSLLGVIIAYLLPSRREYYARNKYSYLEQINNLKNNSVLNEQEYTVEKIKIMNM